MEVLKKCMLATTFTEKLFNCLPEECIFQPKLNGMRATYQDGILYSRSGIPIRTVPHINQSLQALNLYGIALDGELYSHGLPLEEILSIVKRGKVKEEEYRKIQYHIFDCIISNTTQKDRLEHLKHLVPTTPHLQLVFSNLDAKNNYKKVLHQALEGGYEGIILRDPSALYQERRTPSMLKVKPILTLTLPITGYSQEIDKMGDTKDSLGAIMVRHHNGKIFSVGTGPLFTKENRSKLWMEGEKMLSKNLTFQYSDTTKYGIPKFCSATAITSKEDEDI